jgi:multiple sugar transport system permease protein
MDSALASYVPTLLRYMLVAVSLGLLMFAAYKVQRWLGVKHESAAGRSLVLPWLIGFLIFTVYTVGSSLYLSFTEFNLFQPPEWVGLDNYTELFQVQFASLNSPEQRSEDVLPRRYDEVFRIEWPNGGLVFGAKEEGFWRGLKLTLPYALITVPVGLIASLSVALLLNQNVKGLGFWRVLYYMPAVLPAVATALLWRWIFSGTGLLNSLLSPIYNLFGWEAPRWFTDPNYVLPAFVLLSLWGVFGANSVILLAGLKGIPQELYEAASIDGANDWNKFWSVTLPMLSPALFYNLVVSTIAALQIFDPAAFIETPAQAGTFLNFVIYQEAFTLRNMGMASAMSWIMLLMIMALTALVFRSSTAWVFYTGERADS